MEGFGDNLQQFNSVREDNHTASIEASGDPMRHGRLPKFIPTLPFAINGVVHTQPFDNRCHCDWPKCVRSVASAWKG